jgi:transposase
MRITGAVDAATLKAAVAALVMDGSDDPIPPGVRVWIATGHTDMRRGMNSLALLVQEAFTGDPHGGDLMCSVASGKLIKILWHDGLGMSLYAKRLERGRFLWPSPADGVVTITPAQLGYLLEGIDWRMPQHTWRPQAAG